MSQLNISIPPALKTWIDHRVAEGRYSSASDYVRDLVRRDQDTAQEENEWLRGLIAEGLASGVVDEEPEDVLRVIMAERRARRNPA
ncbi:MAG: type II toxin-antitoxin system ParD family antitoxin [Sphingobium sp.]|jgi:antitoxin ParD1/3/4|nr:type II toxin-antitoxin system ParD family antitoxin [Sphingobium sp.]MCI1272171.1 type II toxin-antitoxin system ParD family antitoxin [Sphingobium sp.]MCI1756784.1 type II toxin-antitoxin system ParD family antitoxin [Sphingobium sp.]MCI2052375.1 type II toxin-antitoxin system ParD family antitoxin [Sphingobium sp.]